MWKNEPHGWRTCTFHRCVGRFMGMLDAPVWKISLKLVQVPSRSKAMLFVTFGNISAQVELPVLKQQSSLEVSLNAFQFNGHSKPKFKTGLETPLMSERKKKQHIYHMQQIKKIEVNKYLI